jgi:hypothetical protein
MSTGTKNLGLVKAIWVGMTPPTNTSMIWYDTNIGVHLHKYYNTSTSLWEAFTLNGANSPLYRSDGNIILLYDSAQFEIDINGNLHIKDDVLASVTPPFPISDITGLSDALNGKVDKVLGKSLLSDIEIARLATVVNYTHPSIHTPSIISQDANNRFVTDSEKLEWSGKQDALGYVPYDASNPNGYITEAYFQNNYFVSVYRISLPSQTTVQSRVDNAIEGVNYPTGWTLYAAGDNPNDLVIEHNLNKGMTITEIDSVSVLGKRRLIGNAAYAGLIQPDSNTLRIEGLATVSTKIVINLIFA